ncbi:MAG TPA: hypothetical protein ENF24_00750 [Methanosarcinales archaeon]|nr:hypothetical protein [Methanosarcinales archaeon]
MAIYSTDVGLVVTVIEVLAAIVAGFYGLVIYQSTKGEATMFVFVAIFAVLVAILGASDLLEPIFGTDAILGRSVSKAIENTIIPALSVLAVLIATELSRFARGG